MADLHVVYRPKSFDEMVGQEPVIQSLKEFKKNGGFPHAILFTGGSGEGKTTLARIIAGEIGADQANIIEIDAASHSGVENVRDLTATLQYTGFGKNPTKVFIIDEAHQISKAGANAFLKSIEEPPDHVYFIFCTTEGDKILDTIKTRCNTFNLKPVPYAQIEELLLVVADEENIKLDAKSINLIAQEAQGSPRRALTYLSKARGCKSLDDVKIILEQPDEDAEVIELCRLLVSKKDIYWKQVVKLIKKMEEKSPESIRMVILNYTAKVLMGTEDEEYATRLLALLEAFSKPFNANEKFAPLLLALGTLILAN